MKHISKIIFNVLIGCMFYTSIFSQTDTTKSDLSLDFGFTRDKNINLWPVFKRTVSPDFKDIQILFPLFRYQNDKLAPRKFSYLLPFYWNDSNATFKDFRLLSLFYPSVVRINHNKILNIHSFKLFEFAPKINLLEISKSPDGLFVDNNLLLLLWYKNDKIRQKYFLVFFPFYWSFKNGENSSSTFFPIYSKGNSPSFNYLAITPLFWHFKRPLRTTNFLFPVWWNRKAGSDENRQFTNIVFPFYWSFKDKTKTNKVLFPLIWNFKDKNYQSYTFLPFFSTGKSPDNSWRYTMATPVFWHFRNPESTTNFLFPIWWNRKAGSGEDTRITNVVFPVYWSYKDKTKTNKVFFPIYWSYKDKAKTNKVLFPLIWSFKKPDYHSYTFLPFFSTGKSSDDRFKYIMATPVFWHFRNPESTTNFLFPIWWNRKAGSGENTRITNVVFPFYWSYKDKTTTNKVFFPIYWSYKYKAKTNKVLFPLIWSFKDSVYRSFTFLPLFSTGKSSDNRFTYTMATPVFWHFRNPESTTNFLFPIWWNRKAGSGEDTKLTNVVFPFYWSYKDKIKTNNVLFPFYWSYKDNTKNNKVFFPLFWSLKDTVYRSYTFLPLFSTGKSPDDHYKYTMATPVFWHFRNPESTTNFLFPIWWNRKSGSGEDTRITNIVFPFYWSYKDKTKTNKVLFPLIWSFKKTDYQSYTFLPFFSTGKSSDNRFKYTMATPVFWHFRNPESTTNFLFPIWWNRKSGSGEDIRLTNTVFPFYWSYMDKTKTNKVLFPLIWSFKNPDFQSYTFLPFFSTGKSSDNRYNYIMTTPVFWHIETPESNRNILFPIWWNRKSGSGEETSLTNIVFPVYWSVKDKFHENKILFPILWSFKSEFRRSYTFFPFFSVKKTITPEKKRVMVTPFFWHITTPNKKRNILFPIFWNKIQDTGSVRKLTNVLFPIFWNKIEGSGADKKLTNVLFPVIWQYKSHVKNNLVLFPLLYSFRNPYHRSFAFLPFLSVGHSTDRERKHVMITPLFWHFKRPELKRTILFPLFSSYSDTLKTKKLNLGILLLRYKSQPEKTSLHILYPLCNYTKDTGLTYFRFAPVVWYKKTPESRFFSIQPFYYHQKSRESNSYHLFWQLFTWENQFNKRKSVNFLWKTLYWNRYENQDHEFRFLYLVFADVKKDGNIEKSLFPLYMYTSQTNGARSLSLLFHFYHTFKKPIAGTSEFYMEEKIFWFIRLRSNYKKLKAEGIDKINLR
jgi:hypothetical protein